MILVKVPGVNGLGKTFGTRNAGNKILFGLQVKRLEEIHVDNDNLPEQEKLIYKNSLNLFEKEDRVIFLGGDHSISYSIGSAFFEKYPNGKLIVFDAHADSMQAMKEPTHEEWLRALIERRDLFGEDVLLIGMRKVEEEEKKFLEKKNVQTISVEEIKYDLAKSLRKLRRFLEIDGFKDNYYEERGSLDKKVKGKNKSAIYVSFDIDVFKNAKATSYVEGDLKEGEVVKLLNVIFEAGSRIKGMDLVEVNLEKDGLDETLRLARNVVERFIKYSERHKFSANFVCLPLDVKNKVLERIQKFHCKNFWCSQGANREMSRSF